MYAERKKKTPVKDLDRANVMQLKRLLKKSWILRQGWCAALVRGKPAAN